MSELIVFRFFKITAVVYRRMRVQEVTWYKPAPGWMKANIDGEDRGQLGNVTRGGAFRMYRGFLKGFFKTIS